MHLRDLYEDADFPRRLPRPRAGFSQIEAFRSLGQVFAERPDAVLQHLVDTSTQYCGADSAGISLEEMGDNGELRFRWVAVSGTFAAFVNGVTPRFFSPCGTTLSRGKPQLYRVTKPYYDFLGIDAEPINDGLLIPWQAADMRGTIWAVSHSAEVFDFEDFRLLDALADFASSAVRVNSQQNLLQQRAAAEAASAVSSELAHQINNPLQSVTAALSLIKQQGSGNEPWADIALQETERITTLVKRLASSASS